MTIPKEFQDELQSHLANRLDPDDLQGKLAGIIGDRPSQYAKSPILWNAAFRKLELPARFLPFDVDAEKLAGVVAALRKIESLLGFSVTVPYKVEVIRHLDGLDEKARQIGAVNTVVRTRDGRLIGYNTDGSGFLATLSQREGDAAPLADRLKGKNALVIGAGGASRAVCFYLAELIRPGRLVIANRSRSAASILAAEIQNAYGNARGIPEEEISQEAPSAAIIVNTSTKGQSGVRKLADDQATILEPYSALAPAKPLLVKGAVLAGAPQEGTHDWLKGSLEDIDANHRASLKIALSLNPTTVCYDLIYSPLETAFLRHARWNGLVTVNGKGMNIAQAADAFFDKGCREWLTSLKRHNETTYKMVVEAMTQVW